MKAQNRVSLEEARAWGLLNKSKLLVGRLKHRMTIEQANAAAISEIQKPTKEALNPSHRTIKGWREIGGKRNFYKSKWEMNYARTLQFKKEQGLILDWEYEPHTFWFEGVKRGVNNYKPDFKITLNDGRHEWHEVKGFLDDKSKTKLVRMKKYYPSETVHVIGKSAMTALERQVGSIVGWE